MALKDSIGKPIYVGDTVVYATRNGSRAILRPGVVTGTSENATSNTPGALRTSNTVFIRTSGGADASRDPEQVAVVSPKKAAANKKALD